MIPKHYRIHIVLMLSVLAMIVIPLLNEEKPDEQKAQRATAAATQFLELVDTQKYAESWEVSAELLRQKVDQQKWSEHLSRARALAGAVEERTADDSTYSTEAHDSPDGEYIVLTYKTRFKNQGQLSETITVMLEKDHNWRVAGYFID